MSLGLASTVIAAAGCADVESSVEAETTTVEQASTTANAITLPSTFHLLGQSVPNVTPAGFILSATGTNAHGYYPVSTLTNSSAVWYTPTLSGKLAPSTAKVILWTNAPAHSSIVTVKFEIVDDNGENPRFLGSASADVFTSGTGNHTTNFAPVTIPSLSLLNQRIRVSIAHVAGAPVQIVYNGGIDFDSRITFEPIQATRQDIAPSKDAYVLHSSVGGGTPDSNYGSADVLVIGSNRITSRGLFGYSLANIPRNAVISRAELFVPKVLGSPSGTFFGNVLKINHDAVWHEDTVTWNNKPATTDIGATLQYDIREAGSASADVTEIVAASIAGGATEIGFTIAPVNSNIFLWSKENTAGESPVLLRIDFSND